MYLIKNKNTGEIVYQSDLEINLFSIYHMNLKRNFPIISIDNYELITINDENIIKKINQSTKIIYKDNEFVYTNEESPINFESNIDRIKQLQCQIDFLQHQINQLKK